MRKEHIIFLSLMAASAVILGMFLGFVGNLTNIVDITEYEESLYSQNQPEPTVSSSQEKTYSETGADTGLIDVADNFAIIESQLQYTQTEATTYPPAAPRPTENSGSVSSATIILSMAERQQIFDMLHSLGMNNSDNFSDLIKEYQRMQNLPQTGTIDEVTLNSIINRSVSDSMDYISNRVE